MFNKYLGYLCLCFGSLFSLSPLFGIPYGVEQTLFTFLGFIGCALFQIADALSAKAFVESHSALKEGDSKGSDEAKGSE